MWQRGGKFGLHRKLKSASTLIYSILFLIRKSYRDYHNPLSQFIFMTIFAILPIVMQVSRRYPDEPIDADR